MFKQDSQQRQAVPVRIYKTDGRIMLAAPMPGLEPENISVTLSGDRVTIQGEYRGPRQEERDLLAAEWTVGPYYREVTLPQPVNGQMTNATYGNGVLVLVMPIAASGQQPSHGEFQLEVIESTRGERVGHTGRAIHETTTAEHRQKVEQTARGAGETKFKHSWS